MRPRNLILRSTGLLIFFTFIIISCKKDDSSTPASSVPTYPVSATILNPVGQPQGGATLTLKNPPSNEAKFTAITDSSGRATIQAPEGEQTLLAKMGSVFQTEFNVTVAASQSGTNAGTVTLQQNVALGRVLVIYADCEELETVLRSDSVGFTNFDTTTVYVMRARAATDSAATLTYLRTYSLVFSDCNCGDEDGYPLLARIYGRYVQGGGKIYGGHYNYMNLQYIFPPYYQTPTSSSNDSITVINANLSNALGYTILRWPGSTGYEKWTDLPVGASTVYVVFTRTSGSSSSPQGVPVIVENRLGTGKYLWTIYHNQDILTDPHLIKIVRFFLYSL